MQNKKRKLRSWVKYEDKICEHCRRVFTNVHAQSQKKWQKVRFCSLQCNAKRKIQLVKIKYCLKCKKEIVRSNYEKPGDYKKRKYCSRKCSRSIFWKGGISKDFSRYCNKRRAMKQGNGGEHTTEQWLALKTKCNNSCVSCGKAEPNITLTRDHIVPIFFGGTDNIENIQPLCKSCNSKKSTKTIDFVKYNVCMV